MNRGHTAVFGGGIVPGGFWHLRRIGAGRACRPNCVLLEEAWCRGGHLNPISEFASLSVAIKRLSLGRHQASKGRIDARQGTVWLSPPDFQEGQVDFARGMPEFLHIHLPLSQFSSSHFDNDTDEPSVDVLSFDSSIEDPLLAEIGFAVVSELKTETSAGGLLVEALASSLAMRLLQRPPGASRTRFFPRRSHQGLDQRRLVRVLDFIDANLEGDLSLERMATIACLSRYHFARALRQAVGNSPHRYVSAKRLVRAKALLIHGDRPLVDIALALGFSSQANFTRAFKEATGEAPGHFRQAAGLQPIESSPTRNRQSRLALA